IEALNNQQETAPCLHPFIGTSADSQLDGIPFRLIDYIELVDWSARQFREDKAQLSKSTPPILERLNINQLNWFKACTELERPRTTSVGCIKSAMIAKRVFNRKRINLFRLDS
ncbi:transposase, partial [Vibrio brasiliensis]|nr:transposase [Vibrio brasiliensis]